MTKTKRVALLAMVCLSCAAPAQAHRRWQRPGAPHKVMRTSACPFDGADTMFTIVNAGVTGVTLTQIAAIQTAVRDESFAVRLYYGTHCARFGPGGIPIYLSNGCSPIPSGGTTCQMSGVHYPSYSRPYASPAIYVATGLTPYTTWVRAFSHEVVEDLVNPSGTRWFGNYLAEVCNPVENLTYEVDQLRVSDFVTPNYWVQGPRPWDAGHYL